MIKNIFFDFNGTIINDLDLCIELLNKFLKEQNKKTVTKEEYKEIFTFPIKSYYEKAGIDFNIESYESLAIRFINEYQPRSMNCGLFDCVVSTLKELRKRKDLKLFILSASEKNNLYEQCLNYDIVKYFDDILGIDDIHAKSKVMIAKKYIADNKIDPNETLFIGDTLHDNEVAKEVGCKSVLVSCGHQSVNVLKKANVEIYNDISELLKIV